MRSFMLLLLLLSTQLYAQNLVTPTQRLQQTIQFEDDLDLENMELALQRQLQAFRRRAPQGTIRFGSTNYPAAKLRESVEHFLVLVGETKQCLSAAAREACMSQLSKRLNDEFLLFVPTPAQNEPGFGQEKTTLYTAYFSPDLVGARTPSERFKNPIYAMPPREDLRTKRREEIYFDNALAGQGLELFWVEDSLFDIYILHVEGGGRVRVQNPDGSESKAYLSYAGTNGQRFEFISKYMIAQGMLPANRASIENQARYIEENPQHARDIFASSPSYVYFKETQTEPLGVRNIPLTENRSLAIDTRIYTEVGMITFVQTERPFRNERGAVEFRPFSRFFVSQDTGGAIRGNARCDLYMGYGDEAALAAHNIKRMGRQIFLVKK